MYVEKIKASRSNEISGIRVKKNRERGKSNKTGPWLINEDIMARGVNEANVRDRKRQR